MFRHVSVNRIKIRRWKKSDKKPHNRKEDDIKLLHENLNDLQKCDPDNTQLEVDLINRFHMNLAKSTGNPIVIISMEPVYSLLPRMRNLIYANIEGEKEYTFDLQTKILKAVKEKNMEDSYKYSVELLNRNMEVYDRYFKGTL